MEYYINPKLELKPKLKLNDVELAYIEFCKSIINQLNEHGVEIQVIEKKFIFK
jgi:hypothetical protein